MKNLIFLLLMFMSCSIFGQGPIIEGTYLPVRGTRIEQVYDTAATKLDIPKGGANQVWDYSNKFVDIVDTFSLATFHPDSTPYAHHFPEATHASYLRMPLQDGDSLYLFFKVDTAGVHNVGNFSIQKKYDTTFTPEANKIVPDPNEFMIPARVKIDQVRYDTSRYIGYGKQAIPFPPYSVNVKLVQTKYKEMRAIGYGSLTTPVGKFNDVMLAKEIIQRTDSFYVDLNGTGDYRYNSLLPPLQVDHNKYHFLRNNTFGSTHLMLLQSDAKDTQMQLGWFTLPVDFGFIEGNVKDSAGNAVTAGEVYLYRENSNFTKNDILLREKLDGSGNYRFDSIPYGLYRIAVRPDESIYTNSLTTYYGDTTNWLDAITIRTTTDTSGIDINLYYHPKKAGNGAISGIINLNLCIDRQCKTEGDPVPDVDVVLEQIPGGVIDGVTSGSTGEFIFDELNQGNYRLFVDIPGLHMAETYDFSVSGDSTSGFDFTVGSDSIYTGQLLSVPFPGTQAKPQPVLTVYPNPSIGQVTVKYLINSPGYINMVLYNMLGEKIAIIDSGEKTEGWHQLILENHLFPYSGLYVIQLYDGYYSGATNIIRQ